MAFGKVAYVAYTFPVLTQTFTVREVAALRDRGLDVDVFAVRRGPDGQLDPEGRDEAARTSYLTGPLTLRGASALFGWLVRRPLRFFQTLIACLGGGYRDNALACRLRAPLQFALGAELASCLRRGTGYRRIHAQFVDAGSTVAFAAARLTDLPFSFTNHTAYNPFLLPVKARHADVMVSISDYDRERIVADCGQAVRERVAVSRVGIRLGDWTGLVRRPEPGRVLVVGGLRDKKGHDVLLRAAALLSGSGVELEIRVAGGGSREDELRALAADLGVNAVFLGPVPPSAVREELERAAVFCLPCREAQNGDVDGVPVALMEAMAGGVPVVSTRISGIPELIEDNISGRLAEPADAASLADALGDVLRDPAGAAERATRGRERVAELHDLDRTSASLAHLLASETR